MWHREYRISLWVGSLNKSSLFSETVDNVLFAESTRPLQTSYTKRAFSVVLGFRGEIPQFQRGIRRHFVWNRASLRFVIFLFQLTFIIKRPIVTDSGRLLYTTGDVSGAVRLFLSLLKGASAISSAAGQLYLGEAPLRTPSNDKLYLDDFRVAFNVNYHFHLSEIG